jgi:hypothetical protein
MGNDPRRAKGDGVKQTRDFRIAIRLAQHAAEIGVWNRVAFQVAVTRGDLVMTNLLQRQRLDAQEAAMDALDELVKPYERRYFEAALAEERKATG